MTATNTVGPVLIASELSNQIIMAIKQLNPKAEIIQRGAYFRVLVPELCRLTKQAVEEITDNSFILPDSLELVMPSFKGKLSCTSEEVTWSLNK